MIATPGAVLIPPYSVARLEWCDLSRGGREYHDGEISGGSARCDDHDDRDDHDDADESRKLHSPGLTEQARNHLDRLRIPHRP
jgi:hypothetical protein